LSFLKKISKHLKKKKNKLELSTKAIHEWRRHPIPARFLGRKDHGELRDDYKIFINPSVTEVLCTTTAEALAMGKFVIIPKHASNLFFEQFPNCLVYRNKKQFVEKLEYAISKRPKPLSSELAHQLTWEAGTERFVNAAITTRREACRIQRLEQSNYYENILHFVTNHETFFRNNIAPKKINQCEKNEE